MPLKLILGLLTLVVLMAGCGASTVGTVAADCPIMLRYGGATYVETGRQTNWPARPLGRADMTACDDMGDDARGAYFPEDPRQVKVWTFDVGADIALGVRRGDRFAVFLSERLREGEARAIAHDLSQSLPETDPVTVSVDGPLLVSHGSSGAGMGAIVGGRITNEDGCLRLGGHPVVWPQGTSWRGGSSPAVVLPDGVAVEIGGEVTGGGGNTYADDLEKYGAEAATLARSCAGETNEVAWFNPGSEVTAVP